MEGTPPNDDQKQTIVVKVEDQESLKQAAKKTIEQIAIIKSCNLVLAEDAVFALLLKGAASSSAPDSLSVTVSHTSEKDGKSITKEITLTKGNLKEIYKKFTKNTYLRRLAEYLRNEISYFAEKNNIPGDLAQQLNITTLSSSGTALTPRQKAWASSFNQGNSLLESDPDLLKVAILLAQNFEQKFFKGSKTTIKKAKPSPKRQGQQKGKADQSPGAGHSQDKSNAKKPKASKNKGIKKSK